MILNYSTQKKVSKPTINIAWPNNKREEIYKCRVKLEQAYIIHKATLIAIMMPSITMSLKQVDDLNIDTLILKMNAKPNLICLNKKTNSISWRGQQYK